MQKLYENFHIIHFQKRIVSAETIRRNTVYNTSKICFGSVDNFGRFKKNLDVELKFKL